VVERLSQCVCVCVSGSRGTLGRLLYSGVVIVLQRLPRRAA
jgi:hypothetical protein